MRMSTTSRAALRFSTSGEPVDGGGIAVGGSLIVGCFALFGGCIALVLCNLCWLLLGWECNVDWNPG